jgi:LPS-assembly lipoprotein
MRRMSLAYRFTQYAALMLLVVLTLASCGFHLRGSGGDSSFAQRLYLDGPAGHTAFAGLFGTVLTTVGGSLAGTPADSTGIVYIYRATSLCQPITLSRTGRATGFDLSYRIVYDVRTPKGEVVQSRKEFEIKRDYFNDQTLPLAQQAEEAQIYEALSNEAAQSLLRRVVNALRKMPEPGPEPATPAEKKS